MTYQENSTIENILIAIGQIANYIFLIIGCMLPFYVIFGRKISRKSETFLQHITSPLRTTAFKIKTSIDLSMPLSKKDLQKYSYLTFWLDELANIAWTTEESVRCSSFFLKESDFTGIQQPEKIIGVFLDHARKVAPGLSIPYMTPKVFIEDLSTAEGQFIVDRDAWVSIKLNRKFSQDRLGTRAILAHEICHYILENSGIRKKSYQLNERYTDLCMFVCGFSDIFLTGYKGKLPGYTHSRHRLGYLTDEEYTFARRYVHFLRRSNKIKPLDEFETLKQKLNNLLGTDRNALYRLVELERQQNPSYSEKELYKRAIYRLERDRRS